MTRIVRSIAHCLFPGASPVDVRSLEDAAALARYAKAGDPRAFEVLVHRYQAMVVHTCCRVMASPADADDAAQETFLKLARRAGEVRSNVAAWLHACALRTSIDLLRARTTRQRAELDVVERESSDEVERTWREIKPLLDEAIAALEESDRDLIVSRFLAGRPQVEMAHEAGVNPGTMQRRIDAALNRLRLELRKRGVSSGIMTAVGAVGVGGVSLEAVLTHAGSEGVRHGLTSSLMSIGLAEMGSAPAIVSAAGLGLATVAVVSVVGLGAIGGFWFFGSSTPVFTGLAIAAPVKTAAGGFDRPTKETKRSTLVSMISADGSGGAMTHVGDEIRLEFPSKKLDGKLVAIVLRVKEVDAGSSPIAAKVLIESTTLPADNPFHSLIGTTKDARIQIDDEHVKFELTTDWKPTEEEVRESRSIPPVILWSGARRVEEAKLAKPAGPAPKIPAFAGTWNWIEDWSLRFDPDNLYVTWMTDAGEEFNAFRFRVIEWENAGSYSRIQAIVSESSKENALVGKRVKVLARRNANGYTIVFHEPDSKAINEWPAGFDVKKGDGLLLLKFREGK